MNKQGELFETPIKEDGKKNYMRSRNGNESFSPTFTDKDFVKDFDEYCKRLKLNKTETAQKWLIERMAIEKENYLSSLTKEELIALIKKLA